MSANTPDADKLMAEHAKAVTAMNAVFELFPAELRPDPNAPPPASRRAEKLIVVRLGMIEFRVGSPLKAYRNYPFAGLLVQRDIGKKSRAWSRFITEWRVRRRPRRDLPTCWISRASTNSLNSAK